MAGYINAETYRNNWRRSGFTGQDFADGGSDRPVDALVTDGDASVIRSRIKEHLDAGTDHVCVQALGEKPFEFPAANGAEYLRL